MEGETMMATMVNNEADLRAALANGGEIHVDSSAVVTLSQTLEVTQPTKLIGGKFVKSSGPAFHITSSNVEFDGVQIAGGEVAAGYDDTQKLIYAQGTEAAPLGNLWLHECKLFGSRGDNIWLEWCRESNVTNNLIKRFLYSGIMVISGEGIIIQGNNVYDARMTGEVPNVYGIAVTDLDNTEAARSRDCTIIGNRVDQIDWEAIDTHGGDRITIVGNTVSRSPRGIALVTGNSTRLTAPTRCVVSGNNVDGAGTRRPIREGIWLGGIANVPADGVVTGNIVTNYPWTIGTPYVDRSKTYIGGNNVPLVDWTPIEMDEFNAHGTWPPEFKVDGNTTYLRGAGYPKSGTSRIYGRIPNAHAWPSQLTMVGAVKGSDSGGSIGMFAAHPDGSIELFYKSLDDTPAFFLSGSYEAV
jgi:hypothetical protein